MQVNRSLVSMLLATSRFKTRHPLDYETTTSLTYDIQVSDGVFDVPVTVTIDITDVNEPPSAIAQEVTCFREHAARDPVDRLSTLTQTPSPSCLPHRQWEPCQPLPRSLPTGAESDLHSRSGLHRPGLIHLHSV